MSALEWIANVVGVVVVFAGALWIGYGPERG